MIIDSHQHFWKFDPVRDAWIDNSMQVLRKDFLPKDLKPILESNKVDGCIAVQADQSEAETAFLLQFAKENPMVKGVVGWVDLCNNNVNERLAYFSKNELLKGIRHISQAEADNFLLRKDFQNGISKLEKFDLVYDILIFPKQLPAAIKLVKKFPNQRFVLNHMAKPKISEKLDANWEGQIKTLASCENIACKISGLVTETTNYNWIQNNFKPFLEIVFNAFGMDRVLFGSDWPVCLLAASYNEVLQIVENFTKGFSEPERNKLFGQNATRIYKL
tara:strand:+ start:64508 stop:65332 length:825 start_codon:yes stop_codon:yes gene_type:complete